ncbi:hypothetical protein BsWGS_02213 [Bradybaena similaris]
MRVGKVMPFTWCLQLLSLGLLLNVDSCCGAVQPCTHNNMTLLGSPCRYKCHCLNNKCDTNAECTESRGCEQGWFGPACQYVDLLTINATTSTPAWVYDFPDNLCNTGQDPVTISLKGTAYFTWLRLKLRANFTVSSQVFQLHLKSGVGSTVDCLNMYTSAVSDTILDIHCQPGVFFQKLDITGEGVLSLCQVYISGGRNVALGQETHQTSDYDNMFSWHAVDGATNSEYYHRSCSHTSFNDNKPTWTLTFGRPHQVNRYVLYNRNLEQQRLQGFNLEADQKNGSAAFVYTGPSISQDIYRIQSDTPHIPVSSVKVSVTYKEGNYTFLTLCEVEIFGDAVCPAGKYGKECNNSCNCAKSGENCFVSTGGCPSGCAAGYQWEGCQIPCPQKTFGQDCRETCSTNCSSQLCDTVNGKCASCVPGTTGDYCDQVCPQKTFGQNCSETCSTNCSSQLCDTVHGKCASCVRGTTGDYCDQACPQKTFGQDCRETCSTNCYSQLCDRVNGKCVSCVPGTIGDYCDQACPQKTFGQDCRETCSTNCSSQLCDTVNGKCASCVRGTTGDYCDQVCPQKRFSQNCSETCSTNCSSQLCDTVNGKCVPCVPETTGDYCDQEQLVDPPGPSPPVAAIVGPVVACVVLITLVIIGVLIWRTRRHKSDGPEETPPHKINNYAEKDSIRAEESSTATTVPDEALTAQAKSPVMKKPKSDPDGNHESNHVNGVYFNQLSEHPETVIQFGNVDNVKATHGKEFYQEHLNLMPTNSSATTTVAMSPENHKKNSYQNISLYENPRIRLPTDILKNDGDYINASLNDDFQQKKQYIASQENPYEMPMDLLASTQPAGHANYDYPVPSTDDSTTNSYMKISECVANTFEDSNDIIDNPYESVNNDTVANVYDVINDSNLNI